MRLATWRLLPCLPTTSDYGSSALGHMDRHGAEVEPLVAHPCEARTAESLRERRGRRALAHAREHGIREVDPYDARGRIGPREQREGEVAGADAEVERDLIRPETRELDRAAPPCPIAPEGEDAVEEVVPRGDHVEHRRDAMTVIAGSPVAGACHRASR